MKRLLMLSFSFVIIVSYAFGQGAMKERSLKISSPAFKNDGLIPSKYTCDGTNINPPLRIDNVPNDTKSFALVFDDMDAPRGSYVHWILWNIDPRMTEIKEYSIPEGSIQGLNDFKKNNYGGPCPPRRAHRYVFKIYALDTQLNLNPNSTKADFEKAIAGHVLSQAQLIGSYKKIDSKK